MHIFQILTKKKKKKSIEQQKGIPCSMRNRLDLMLSITSSTRCGSYFSEMPLHIIHLYSHFRNNKVHEPNVLHCIICFAEIQS